MKFFFLKPYPNPPKVEAVEGKKESEIQLFHREIALLHYYTEIPLNDNNANEKAKIYGQGSGVKLMQHYNEITKGSLNITNHRFAVKNITNVILLLNNYPKGKEKAENDLKIAKTKKN